MKEDIIEYVKRTDTQPTDDIPERITISTISALPQLDELKDENLFEVSEFTFASATTSYYTSKSVRWSTILAKVQESSKYAVDAQYFAARVATLTNDTLGVQSSEITADKDRTVWKYLTTKLWDQISKTVTNLLGTTDAVDDRPYVWSDVWTLARGEVMLAAYMATLDERITILERQTMAFDQDMYFTTELTTFQDGGNGTTTTPQWSDETMTAAYHNPESGIRSDGFVMAFYHTNQVSNTFTCPEQGILTLYGWIDSTNVTNSKYLPTAWCALEGLIRMNESAEQSWEILQIQPVTPAKQFSYVSFCVPVMKDLEVRLELGFPPGPASDRYDRSKIPESLANTRANAFIGGIFSRYRHIADVQPTT